VNVIHGQVQTPQGRTKRNIGRDGSPHVIPGKYYLGCFHGETTTRIMFIGAGGCHTKDEMTANS